MTGVSITVDVDGEAGLPDGGRHHEHRLSSRTERLYGIDRGMPRILDVLARHEVAATFYVPGRTAERHPGTVRGIVAHGHEVGHHGHAHRPLHRMDRDAQRADLRAGLAALEAVTGDPPRGYRAPGWELTPETLELLAEHGFTHDSSLMGDDRPHRLDSGLVELPVHWTLDDAPYFQRPADPAPLLAVWLAEIEAAVQDARHLTLTLHPEILGRPHRIVVLERILTHCRLTGVPVLPHGAVAPA